MLENNLGVVNVGLDRIHWALYDKLHPDGSGQVDHNITAVHQFRQHRLVMN